MKIPPDGATCQIFRYYLTVTRTTTGLFVPETRNGTNEMDELFFTSEWPSSRRALGTTSCLQTSTALESSEHLRVAHFVLSSRGNALHNWNDCRSTDSIQDMILH